MEVIKWNQENALSLLLFFVNIWHYGFTFLDVPHVAVDGQEVGQQWLDKRYCHVTSCTDPSINRPPSTLSTNLQTYIILRTAKGGPLTFAYLLTLLKWYTSCEVCASRKRCTRRNTLACLYKIWKWNDKNVRYSEQTDIPVDVLFSLDSCRVGRVG